MCDGASVRKMSQNHRKSVKPSPPHSPFPVSPLGTARITSRHVPHATKSPIMVGRRPNLKERGVRIASRYQARVAFLLLLLLLFLLLLLCILPSSPFPPRRPLNLFLIKEKMRWRRIRMRMRMRERGAGGGRGKEEITQSINK